MSDFAWVVATGLAMSVIALVGSLTLILPKATMQRMLLPLVALAAGALMGGALFHMLPESVEAIGNTASLWIVFAAGFVSFYLLEQALHWHHCHDIDCEHRPVGLLVLVADALHNLIGGIAVGASFTLGVPVGLATWFAAAAHEVPQELGDFGILAHSGYEPRRALWLNFLSGLTFPIGAITAFLLAGVLDVALLVPFAAGNFVYIGASDLLPQLVQPTSLVRKIENSVGLIGGMLLLLVTAGAG